MSESAPSELAAPQRIDKWIWHARFFKTRTLASKFVASGAVRLTRDGDVTRVEKPSFTIQVGDILTFSRSERVRIIEITGICERRGSASVAQTLYTDHSPPIEKKEAPLQTFQREKGTGRPTKKDRRALDAVRSAAK